MKFWKSGYEIFTKIGEHWQKLIRINFFQKKMVQFFWLIFGKLVKILENMAKMGKNRPKSAQNHENRAKNPIFSTFPMVPKHFKETKSTIKTFFRDLLTSTRIESFSPWKLLVLTPRTEQVLIASYSSSTNQQSPCSTIFFFLWQV